jgi:amino acid permease
MFHAARRYLPSKASLAAAVANRTSAITETGRALLPKAQEDLRRAQEALADIHIEVPDTTTWALLGTTFNLLNATTGPGLLALPLAFARCGWFLGTLILISVFALNHVSLLFLLKSCLQTREHSYIGLSMRAGPEMAALVDWASLAFFFGSCVSYLVIIGDTFGQFTERLGSGHFYAGDEAQHFSTLALLGLGAFTAACLAPLSTLRSMDSLQITSGVAMVCILYAAAIIVIAPGTGAEQGIAAEQGGIPAVAKVAAADAGAPRAFAVSSQTLLSLPTMTFCFASQSLFPPALETLHQPATYDHMHTVVWSTMGLTLLIHLCVALGGYLRFGALVTPNVLDSLPQNAWVSTAQAAIVLAFAFTFPMMIFLCRMHIQSILARNSAAANSFAAIADRWRAVATSVESGSAPVGEAADQHTLVSLLLVAASLLAAVLFPNIDALFGLLGGTTAVVISFVAPAVVWERFVGYMYPWQHPRRVFCKVLIGFAALVAALSLPGLLVDILGDLHATAWWVPVSSDAGMSSWSGGLDVQLPPVGANPKGSAVATERASGVAKAATAAVGAALSKHLAKLGTKAFGPLLNNRSSAQRAHETHSEARGRSGAGAGGAHGGTASAANRTVVANAPAASTPAAARVPHENHHDSGHASTAAAHRPKAR